ncbi:Dipeptidyl carboxypeptidase [Alphaproteobacteria bacterium SO-S41]|nr:Dipeptidyl carboxypeptidase [Alphaproteobacteria bacterium SO-S41]
MSDPNPLLEDWTTPFGAPPLDRIRPEHFLPAFEAAMAAQLGNVQRIVTNPAPPAFADLEALERSGRLLDKVSAVFENLSSSASNEALQDIEREMSPRFAQHSDAIRLDPKLFARVNAIHAARATLGLNAEQLRLVEEAHRVLVRAGAGLDETAKPRLKAINEEMASLGTAFRLNVLKDTGDFVLMLESEADLAGLPQFAIDAAAEAAKERGQPGKWAITLQRPSVEPFLSFSARRDLREQAYDAFMKRGDNGNAVDTNRLIGEIVALRQERAHLLGYKNHADFKLDGAMAKTPAAASQLLERVWQPARERALEERADLQAMIDAEGGNFKLAAWDWRYYAEKLRKQRYDFDAAALKPYLQLDRMVDAAFACATKLFGLTFVPAPDVPVYAPEVKVWEVHKDDHIVAVFYGDFFARPGKSSGAWMSNFRDQEKMDGAVIPLVLNNLNLNKPAPGETVLLSWDDASTLFHEFGHGLHGMLSNVTYRSLSGTNVPRDFVEFPSQVYEHWLDQPEVLAEFAVHAETGAAMPAEMIEKLMRAETFNKGFSTVEFLGSAIFDMDLHTRSDLSGFDVHEAEAATRARIGMPEEIALRHRPQHFLHLFDGDAYSAGYYSYMWSEVLDADGFDAFAEKHDPFEPETAKRLYDYVLSAGNTRDPAEAYRLFRGRDPEVEPLLRYRGFAGAAG